MKEFISNPKNKPIIIGVAAVVVVVAVVSILFMTGVLHLSGGAAQQAAAPPVAAPAPPGVAGPPSGPPVAGPPAGAPASTALPAPAPPTTAAPVAGPPTGSGVAKAAKKHGSSTEPKVQVAAATVAPGRNPFQPAYDPKKLKHKSPPIWTILGNSSPVQTGYLPPIQPSSAPNPNGEPIAPPANIVLGRVSGIILSNGVHAIYEANGQSTIVQPGDELPDGNGRVQSIQSDGITVRLTNNQIVRIPVGAGTG